VRTDRIDQAGIITLRAAGRLHHTCMGRTYTGTRVLVLVHDIAIVNAATGELLRELTLEPHQGLPTNRSTKRPQTEKVPAPKGSATLSRVVTLLVTSCAGRHLVVLPRHSSRSEQEPKSTNNGPA